MTATAAGSQVRPGQAPPAQAQAQASTLSTIRALEAESIQIVREVVAEFDRPALLYSGGKDSAVLLHVARKALAPAPLPITLLHVDTGHNLPEVIEYRDRMVAEGGLNLVVAHVEEWIADGRLTERPDGTRNPLQTVPLIDTIEEQKFDALLGGARRDEDRARAKERIFSVRDAFGGWDPRKQRPELWDVYNGRHAPGENTRVFPLSNWTELDIWHYIAVENVELPSIYFAHERDVWLRDGMWMTPGPWFGPGEKDELVRKQVRYRTVGDGSCTGAVESDAVTIEQIVAEISVSRLTERGATRADDRLSEASMEDRKREGYF